MNQNMHYVPLGEEYYFSLVFLMLLEEGLGDDYKSLLLRKYKDLYRLMVCYD